MKRSTDRIIVTSRSQFKRFVAQGVPLSRIRLIQVVKVDLRRTRYYRYGLLEVRDA